MGRMLVVSAPVPHIPCKGLSTERQDRGALCGDRTVRRACEKSSVGLDGSCPVLGPLLAGLGSQVP